MTGEHESQILEVNNSPEAVCVKPASQIQSIHLPNLQLCCAEMLQFHASACLILTVPTAMPTTSSLASTVSHGVKNRPHGSGRLWFYIV